MCRSITTFLQEGGKQASFYFTFPVFMGTGPIQITNKQRKEAS